MFMVLSSWPIATARVHPVHSYISAGQPPTLRPSKQTWALSPPVYCIGCMTYIHHRHFIITQPKGWYSYWRWWCVCWRLRDNYRYLSVPGRHRMVAQHLLLRVQQVFPDVTGDTIDEFVMAAFPGCVTMNNRRNGLKSYQGLVARPDVSCTCVQICTANQSVKVKNFCIFLLYIIVQ